MAIPDIPPEDNWFGSKNKEIPRAMKKLPITVPIISIKKFFLNLNI